MFLYTDNVFPLRGAPVGQRVNVLFLNTESHTHAEIGKHDVYRRTNCENTGFWEICHWNNILSRLKAVQNTLIQALILSLFHLCEIAFVRFISMVLILNANMVNWSSAAVQEVFSYCKNTILVFLFTPRFHSEILSATEISWGNEGSLAPFLSSFMSPLQNKEGMNS